MVNREGIVSLSAFCSKQLTEVNYHPQQADLIIAQITAILAHSLYVNGPILTGNTGYSKQNWVIGK